MKLFYGGAVSVDMCRSCVTSLRPQCRHDITKPGLFKYSLFCNWRALHSLVHRDIIRCSVSNSQRR